MSGFAVFATAASVLPVYARNASFLKPTSSVPSPPAASIELFQSLRTATISADALADLRILQPLRPRLVAALATTGHCRIESRQIRRGVGVHVGRDFQAILTCGFNLPIAGPSLVQFDAPAAFR